MNRNNGRGRGGARRNMSRKPKSRQTQTQSRTVIPRTLNTFGDVNVVQIGSNGAQLQRGRKTLKYIDQVHNIQVASTGDVFPLLNVTQGVSSSQRVGDSGWLEKMYINFKLNTANSDVYTTSRIIIFQWLPNTSLAGGSPTAGQILQTVTEGPLSFYDFQNSNQFIILLDLIIGQSGTADSPTTSSNVIWGGEIPLRCNRKIEWSQGTTFGSNQIYLLDISDSVLAPFPILNLNSRIFFDDSLR